MAQGFEERLLSYIEKDDIKSFNALMAEAQCGGYRMGRFPVLSLLYLYNSRKIIKQYEEKFLKITTWEELREPASVLKRFADKAGKCLRLYISELVTPLEMLLILNKTKKLKAVFPLTQPSKAVKSRLQSVYSIRYSLEIRYEGSEIIIDRRPLSYAERRRITYIGVACLLVLAIGITSMALAIVYAPKKGEVTQFSQINLASNNTYTLIKDVSVPEDFRAEKVKCTIVGGGKRLIFGKNASFGEFSGKMSDLIIETSGTPIFTLCTGSAELSNVTVNVSADVETSEDTAFITIQNLGTFDAVTLNVSGNMRAVTRPEESDGLILAGMTSDNDYQIDEFGRSQYGSITNCTVNYSDFSIKGEVDANATFGGIAGYNSGLIMDCVITGKVTTEVVDLAGACYVNFSDGLIGIVNEANLTQIAESEEWYPVVAGIVIENQSKVQYCKNTGDITVVGWGQVVCGGIVAKTCGQSNYCIQSGNITVTAPTAYIGGIFGTSETLRSTTGYFYLGQADYCISGGKITATLGEGTSFIGGIGGVVSAYKFAQNFGGGVRKSIFMGEIDANKDYCGNIVGVCANGIYEENSYILNFSQYFNFEGNYYLDNSLTSFGATESSYEDGVNDNGEPIIKKEYARVADKGATVVTEDITNNVLYKNILKKFEAKEY